MNMRFSIVTLAAITACALGACKVETSDTTSTSTSATSTATGTGGSGGEATGTSSTATGVGGSGGAGGSTACDPTYTCSDAAASNGNPAKLCDGPAEMLYTALTKCTCTGACATDCADSVCKGNDPSTACKLCLTNEATGCGKEFTACTSG